MNQETKKITHKKLNLPIFALAILAAGFFFGAGVGKASAANCGNTSLNGTTTNSICACGDTVVGGSGYTYSLPADLTCNGTNGLLFGSDHITINGNGHTLTGNGDDSQIGTYGVYNNGHNYDNTTNITATGFDNGIYYKNSTNGTISSTDTNGNMTYGLYISSSSSTTLTSNTAEDNGLGNLFVDGNYNNTIDTSNLVQGNPVLYLYGVNGASGAHKVYSGSSADAGKGYQYAGNIGMFWMINCSYIDLKNVTLPDNNYIDVYLNNTTNTTVNNVHRTGYSSSYEIYLESSSSNTISGNTSDYESLQDGIFLSSSNTNTISTNTVFSISLNSSNSNTLNSNTIATGDGAISFNSSGSNILTNNNLQIATIKLTGTSSNNSINTTNTVKGQPILFLDNQHGTSSTPLVIDGGTLGSYGMIVLANSTYVDMKNINRSDSNFNGVYMENVSSSTLESSTIAIDNTGINCAQTQAIYLGSSNNNILRDNSKFVRLGIAFCVILEP